jgi:HK97 family phage major capsid protein
LPSGYSTAAAGAVLTAEQVESLLIEPLTARAVVLDASPRVFVADGVPLRIPKIDSLDLADPWRGENEQIGEADPVYGELVLLPTALKSLKVIHRISSELARHAVTDITNVLSRALVHRVANAVDRAMLVGDGAGGTILGLANQSGVQVMPAVGAVGVDDLHDAVGRALGADAEPSTWFMNPRDLVTLRKTKTTDGHYLVHPDPTEAGRDRLLGIPVYPTTQLPTNGGAGTSESTIVLADMSQVAVGRDHDVSVTFLAERYADYDQVGIRVTARYDIGALNPEGIVVMQGVTG